MSSSWKFVANQIVGLPENETTDERKDKAMLKSRYNSLDKDTDALYDVLSCYWHLCFYVQNITVMRFQMTK